MAKAWGWLLFQIFWGAPKLRTGSIMITSNWQVLANRSHSKRVTSALMGTHHSGTSHSSSVAPFWGQALVQIFVFFFKERTNILLLIDVLGVGLFLQLRNRLVHLLDAQHQILRGGD